MITEYFIQLKVKSAKNPKKAMRGKNKQLTTILIPIKNESLFKCISSYLSVKYPKKQWKTKLIKKNGEQIEI